MEIAPREFCNEAWREVEVTIKRSIHRENYEKIQPGGRLNQDLMKFELRKV